MIANYRRIPESQLNNLLVNPEELYAFLCPDEDTNDPDYLDIDKAWHIIHFLLNGKASEGEWPWVGAVFGGVEISDEEIGYGPAKYLTPAEVKEVAAALRSVSSDELLSRFDPDAVRQAEIYPEIWSGGDDDRVYISSHYNRLQDFFLTAAEYGEAMILYFN